MIKKFTDLIELLEKLFGKGAVSRTIGTRTNVVRFPKGKQPVDPTTGEFRIEELKGENPDSYQIIKNSIEDRMGDISQMNDSELLNYTANVRRMVNAEFPPPLPEADVVKFGSGQEIKGKGLEELIEKQGTKNSPTTIAGQLETQGKRLEKVGEDLKEITEQKPEFVIDDIMKDYMNTQKIMQSSQRTGYVRATVRQIMREDIQAGKLKLPKELQDQVMQGLGEPIDIYRKVYGEGALEQIDNLADDLGQFRTEEEAAKFARSKYTIEPKAKPVDESISYEELEDIFKKGSDEPEGKADGGIIGYANGGVASMFRERPGYADGGFYEGVLTAGNKQEITPEFLSVMEGIFGVDQEGKIRRLKDSYQQSIDYAKSSDSNSKFSGGYGLPDLSPEEYIAKKQKDLNLQLSQYDEYNKLFGKKITEVPTIDPFSGQQVSAQEQAAFTQPQAEIFPQQELPTVTPEAPFQPYEGQSTSYDSISNRLENIFNNPAIKGYSNFITGSESPFQNIDQFTSSQQSVINQAIENAAKEGRTNITYADYPQTGIAQLMDDGFSPMEYVKTLGSSIIGNPVDQIKTTLGQFTYDPQQQQIKDFYDFQKQSGNNLGTPYPININVSNPVVSSPYVPNVEGANELKNRYNQYLSATTASTPADQLYATYKANVQGKADGGRIGFAGGKSKTILDLIAKANKKLKGKKSMESVDPKTGEVTIPKKPIRQAEEPTGMTTMDSEPEIVDERAIPKQKKKTTQKYNQDIIKAADEIYPSYDDPKIAADQIVDSYAQMKYGLEDQYGLSNKERMDLYTQAYDYVMDYNRGAIGKTTGTINISDEKTAKAFTDFARENDPEGFKKVQKIVDDINNKNVLEEFDIKDREPNASGGIAGLL